MTSRLEPEIRTTHERYLDTRRRIEAGELGWDALAGYFTEGATFIDPAWGRMEELANLRKFLVESTFYEAPGVSVFEYARDGRFSFQMDLLDMVHVNERIRESGWRASASFHMPPKHPRR